MLIPKVCVLPSRSPYLDQHMHVVVSLAFVVNQASPLMTASLLLSGDLPPGSGQKIGSMFGRRNWDSPAAAAYREGPCLGIQKDFAYLSQELPDNLPIASDCALWRQWLV